MTISSSRTKLTLVFGISLLVIGVTYAAIVVERWDGSSNHIGLWNGPSTLMARTLKTPVGETTGAWHYHPGYVYNVVRQGTITIEDGCGEVQSFSAGQAFETSEGRVHRATFSATGFRLGESEPAAQEWESETGSGLQRGPVSSAGVGGNSEKCSG